MQRTLSLAIILLICLASLDAPVQTASRAPVRGAHGMVVSTSPIASYVGIEIMKNGGNAVDAAVAVRFALAVTVPWGGNIGGGGFLVFHDAASGESFTYDYREVAPTRAHRNMYVDVAGEIVPELSTVGHLSAGVPGTVAGLLLALEKHGRLVRQTVLAPAIRLAEEGFPVSYENRWGLHHRRGLEELSGGGTRADRGFLPRSYHCIDGTTELGGHHPLGDAQHGGAGGSELFGAQLIEIRPSADGGRDVEEALRAKGHTLAPRTSLGDAHSIYVDPETEIRLGAADPRMDGKAVGY